MLDAVQHIIHMKYCLYKLQGVDALVPLLNDLDFLINTSAEMYKKSGAFVCFFKLK